MDGHGPADVCVIELGGTVGDIESAPFIEVAEDNKVEGDVVKV